MSKTHPIRAVVRVFACFAAAASLVFATVPAYADETSNNSSTSPQETPSSPQETPTASPDPQNGGSQGAQSGEPNSTATPDPNAAVSPNDPTVTPQPSLLPAPVVTPAGITRPDVSRLQGGDRFETSVAIARHAFYGTSPQTVYLAQGFLLADAMAGGSLRDGPVLLTRGDYLPNVVLAYLNEVKPTKVIALGGTGVISPRVLQQAKVTPTTELGRLAGSNRFETANAIARYAFPNGSSKVYITDGTSYRAGIGPDPLTGSALRDGPILFGTHARGLTASTMDLISSLNPSEIIQLGFIQLGHYRPTGIIGGVDRFATAVEVSKQVMQAHPDVHIAYLTNGFVLADAVSSGGRLDDGSILLAHQNWIPYAVCEHLRTSGINKVIALGGNGAVSQEALNLANQYATNSGTVCPKTPPRGWIAPGGYLQAVDRITPPPGTVVPRSGWNGTKVREVRARLGVGVPLNASMTFDGATRNAVIRFQGRVRLRATGVVDYGTWVRLTSRPWTMDNFQMQPLPLTANRDQRVNAMISFARSQVGSPYTWGGAGSYGDGYDCSGLALQALYAAGIDPQPINVISHAAPTYRSSKELYAHPRLQKLPFAYRSPGDLIFWQGRGGIYHVAIYLGSNQVIESNYGHARQVGLYNWGNIAPYIVRPLAN